MPGPLKLYNPHTTKKEALPPTRPLRLYLPLSPTLRNLAATPPLAEFPGLSVMRLYFFAAILGRAVKSFSLVDKPQEAALLIYGDPLITPELESSPAKVGLSLKVAGVIFKGEGNQEALATVLEYTPQEFQYLTYGTHYRQPLIVSGAALNNARVALARLHDYTERMAAETETVKPVADRKKAEADLESWRSRFYDQFYDDLNLQNALAAIWMMLQSNLGPAEKLALLVEFDRLLGLGLADSVPLVARAEAARSNGSNGYKALSVTPEAKKPLENKRAEAGPQPARPRPKETGKPKGQEVTGREGQTATGKGKTKTKGPPEKAPGQIAPASTGRRKLESSLQVRSFLAETDRFDFTVSLIAHNNRAELRATVESVLFYTTRSSRKIEVIVVDLGSQDGSAEYLDGVTVSYANFRLLNATALLGEAAARNLAFRQGRGQFLLLLDAGLTLGGDLFEALYTELTKDQQPALFGLYPLRLKRDPDNSIIGFEAQAIPPEKEHLARLEVEALEGSLLCLRRALVDPVGFMDEGFKLPYALDLDYSFAFQDKGFSRFALPALTQLINRPAGFSRPDYGLSPSDVERQHQKNWLLFKKSWDLT